MDTILKVTLLVTSLYLIVMSTVNTTHNPKSAIIFKTLPLLLGIACLVSALYAFGVLKGAF